MEYGIKIMRKPKIEKSIIINNKIWTKDVVKELLSHNDKAVVRAVSLLYSFQTVEEKCNSVTKESNGKGFSSYDTEFLSSLALQLLKGHSLSKTQIEAARKRIVKYSGQIFDYMVEKYNG